MKAKGIAYGFLGFLFFFSLGLFSYCFAAKEVKQAPKPDEVWLDPSELPGQTVPQKPLPPREVKKEPQPGDVWLDPSLGMEFVFAQGGCYEIGDLWGNGDSNERPLHTVCVVGFWMGKYEVTQWQWQRLMGNNSSNFKNCGNDCPVEEVSWKEAQEFARRLSQRTGYTFRLPTEAEWEYACRSGGRTEKYAGGDEVNTVAWYSKNSDGRTHTVGQKRPNGLGIYDMTGNVSEWCMDWYDSDYYSISPKDNPKGPSSGTVRVLRGGSWSDLAWNVSCSARRGSRPDLRHSLTGFRLVCVTRQ